ncbi:MAG: hypothetical protein BWY85_00886 [Firmicutes bacterium ADurb.Bin506]|jgi:anti-sigma factor (TIGR02949 family)|nr:MAG: hypothetical protein BWY85_00886 [Firmicutes bacterium ADurb.Bin506]
MMCSMVQRLISAYIDRELSEDDRSRVRRHLASCSECYAVYQSTAAVKSALASMTPVECPPCLWEGVEARISAAPLKAAPARYGGERFSLLRSAASFVKIVAPAAVVGALIAVPVVQLAFGIDLIGPMGARLAGTGAGSNSGVGVATVQADETPRLTLQSIVPAPAARAVSLTAASLGGGSDSLILGAFGDNHLVQLQLDPEDYFTRIGGSVRD